ncbi:PAS domain-containing sensor histidine kinase [Chryseosolibacter indicus]|uniref:histidine kinase n=1 Tax=Chryseosolibacter indicus TaxID=2782351 RepID=A0ABS5VSB1_9BACT|nr:PAS domain-containing sensor histidine kinase [Chryseosolibacter indicus]MBT1703754.1 PAS domain-containing sensor histidine kinase [Chryseosolibacter indicus]
MSIHAPISQVTNDAFREIFQSMSEGIVMVDEMGKIVIANPIAEQIFEYERNELSGLSLEELLPERYRGRHINFRKGFNAHPEPRRMGFGRDLTALKKNGQEFPVEISLSYTQVQGKILVMAFISDISQRKKAEDALKRSEEQLIVYAAELEKKVQSRTEALHKTIQELENEVSERKKAEEEARKSLEKERELNELKTKFVSIASHEFRTPLSTVLSSASLINQYNARGEREKIDKHIQRIKSSVNHLTSILNDFLSLGKLEEGVIDINKALIDIPQFIESIREELIPTFKPGQKFEVQYESPINDINSDVRILRNILFNLVSNASKYSDQDKTILLKCRSENRNFIFEIIDEGIGIPLQDQKHMFERFFRASNAGNVQGTGLGLNIVKRYIDLLGGIISFSSEYGKGSTFTVSVPV